MLFILFLLIVGLVFIVSEIFLPGGIIGACGVCAVIGACAAAFVCWGWLYGVLFCLAAGVLTFLLIYVCLRYVPLSSFGKAVSLQAQLSGGSQDNLYDTYKDYIGKTGITQAALHPSGIVSIDGQRLDVIAEEGFIEAGVTVKVERIDGLTIIVRRVQ